MHGRDRTLGAGPGGEDRRLHKVFIVARGRTDIYASLRRALESEHDVLVIYDRRRQESGPERRGWRSLWSGSEGAFEYGDRRVHTEVDDDIRLRGFGVVRLDEYPERDDTDYERDPGYPEDADYRDDEDDEYDDR